MRSWSSFRRRALLAVSLVCAAPHALRAQPPPALFDAAPNGGGGALLRQPDVARARLVSFRRDLLIGALDEAVATPAPFVLNLFDDVRYVLRRIRVDASVPGYRTWIGAAGARDDVVAALTLGPGGLSGGAVANGLAYSLTATAGGGVLVSERMPSVPPAELPARRLAAQASPSAALLPTPGAALVDILILYTAGARLRAGGESAIHASLANAVAVTNTALARSGVDAVVTAAGIQELPYAEDPGGLGADLSAISTGGRAASMVASLRAAAGADLVALVTGRTTPAACGIAYLGPSPAAIFSATEEACLFAGQWSFSHEIGHNFGADHAPGDPIVSDVPYARGYRDTAIRTLMAYPAPGSTPRFLNYSSSLVREPAGVGHPTGNSLQDNARRIAETAATLAGYVSIARSPDAPLGLSASVEGRRVTISWSAPDTGGPVSVYYLEAGQAPGARAFGPFTTTTPSLVFPDVTPGRYFVRLHSLGPGGTSPPSAELMVDVGPVCAVPGPASVTWTTTGPHVTLRWFAPPGSGPTSYEVGVGRTPGALDVGVFGLGTATATTVAAPPGVYYVRARGVNACGPGGASAEVRIEHPAPAP